MAEKDALNAKKTRKNAEEHGITRKLLRLTCSLNRLARAVSQAIISGTRFGTQDVNAADQAQEIAQWIHKVVEKHSDGDTKQDH